MNHCWLSMSFQVVNCKVVVLFRLLLFALSTDGEVPVYSWAKMKDEWRGDVPLWELVDGVIQHQYNAPQQKKDTSILFSKSPIKRKLWQQNVYWDIIPKFAATPSSSNRFLFWLMADSHLLMEANGYAFGVEQGGSGDTLCLWKMQDGTPERLLLKTVVWKSTTFFRFRITRTFSGRWSVSWSDVPVSPGVGGGGGRDRHNKRRRTLGE